MILYGFLKDSLISKNGIVKVWWEDKEKEEEENFYDLTDEQFMMLSQAVVMSDGALEITAHTAKPEGKNEPQEAPQGDQGQLPSRSSHDVTILRTKNAS